MGLRLASFWTGVLYTVLHLFVLIALAVLVGRGAVSAGQLVVPLTMLPCVHMAVSVEMAFAAHKCDPFGVAVWLAWFGVWLPVATGLLAWLAIGWMAAGGQLSVALTVLSSLLLALLWPPYAAVALFYYELVKSEKPKEKPVA
ncbi:hypothetical protein FJT64_005643 [Amphibalanus amphitrite]|uniref:Uncharacterized protein n=1 Tax=Amphibalanus amphitrite TaxID=1232801 RepID=A0A6A4VZ97_AMPAM|nr:hypothetical protein FJT64_005643 [Amphibalanus amphitrite]